MVDPGNKIKEKATLTLKYSNEIELTIDSVSKHDESCGPATAAYCIVCKRDKQIQTWGTSSTIISSSPLFTLMEQKKTFFLIFLVQVWNGYQSQLASAEGEECSK